MFDSLTRCYCVEVSSEATWMRTWAHQSRPSALLSLCVRVDERTRRHKCIMGTPVETLRVNGTVIDNFTANSEVMRTQEI